MTEPLDLDAIETIARDAAYIAVRYPLRVRGIAILTKADLLALVALARQAEQYREALVSARATLDSARQTSSRYGDWSALGHELGRIDAALAEPAPEDGR